jgi:hypothetical protein
MNYLQDRKNASLVVADMDQLSESLLTVHESLSSLVVRDWWSKLQGQDTLA